MITNETIKKISHNYEVPVRKIPILFWDKRLNKKERNLLGVDDSCPSHIFYHNLNTGKNSFYLQNVISEEDFNAYNYCLLKKTSRDEYRYYMEYLEDYKIVVLGRARMNCKSIKKDNWDETRTWERAGEIFVTSNKSFLFIKCRWNYNFEEKKYEYIQTDEVMGNNSSYYSPFKIDEMSAFKNSGINGEDYSEYSKPILNIFPRYCNVGANKTVDLTSDSNCLISYLKYQEPIIKNGPKQKLISDLISFDLEPLTYEFDYPDKVAIIQKVKEGMCVLRTAVVDHDNMKMIDCARIYIDKKTITSCRPDNSGNWVNMVLRSHCYNWDFELFDFDKEIVKDTKLQYFGDIVEDIDPELKGLAIWSFLSFPITEQLAKSGLKDFVLFILKSTKETGKVNYSLEKYFGMLNPKKSMMDILGVNKHQFKVFSSYIKDQESEEGLCTSNASYISDIKTILINLESEQMCMYSGHLTSEYSISYLDDKSFDLLFSYLKQVKEKIKNIENTSNSWWGERKYCKFIDNISLTAITYGLSIAINMIPTLIDSIDKNITVMYESWNHMMLERQNPVIEVYYDYINMVNQLDSSTSFKPYFNPKKLDELVSMHDMLVNLLNLKKNEIEMKKFDNLLPKWNKWIYSNDKYSVISPKCPDDIAKEGIELHHCVRSYIPKVVQEITNILFIRQNENLDKPFFTVEISNNSSVEQIHGFANRNVGSEPGLQSFVDEWIKKHKLKKKNWDKVR